MRVIVTQQTDYQPRHDIPWDIQRLHDWFDANFPANKPPYDAKHRREDRRVPAPTATLVVGQSFSRCSACGGNADPNESAHIHGGPGGGYEDGSDLGSTNGCGAVFVGRT